ncbi:MAG: S46 family peptidase, partial [Bacteroidota bacterium]
MQFKKWSLLLLGLVFTSALLAQEKASYNPGYYEGMWLPIKLDKNYSEMQSEGINLPLDLVYDESKPSLEDAVVVLDGGSCTAEVISEKGLLLTNHHCAYDGIAALSTAESDLLTDGFWARSLSQERVIPDMTVSFLIHMEEVTEIVIGEDGGADAEARIEELVAKATEENNYEAEVREVFHGSEYYLYVYETFRDVRLVGAPPS